MINRREGHEGPLRPQPRKSRAERIAVLKALLRLPGGKEVVAYYHRKHTSELSGPTALTDALLIQSILKHEYPDGCPGSDDTGNC
jgi:hypothetical protein